MRALVFSLAFTLMLLTASVNTSCGCDEWNCPTSWFTNVRLDFTLLDTTDPNNWDTTVPARTLYEGVPGPSDTNGVWVEVVEDGGYFVDVRNQDFGGGRVGDVSIMRNTNSGEAGEIPISTLRLAIHQREPQGFARTDSIIFRGGLLQEPSERRCCEDLTYFVIEEYRLSFPRAKVQGDHNLPPGRSTNRSSIFATIALQ